MAQWRGPARQLTQINLAGLLRIAAAASYPSRFSGSFSRA
jgi:hypothetical protein